MFWGEWAIWEFINRYNLPYCKLYDEGFQRIGCIICPFHSEKTGKLHDMYRKKWPGVFRKFEKRISKLYFERIESGETMYYNSPEKYLKQWYKNSLAHWYKGKKTKEGFFDL